MPNESSPPQSYRRFVSRYPQLEESWERARAAERDGPADDKARRLLKLAIAIGALREGAVTSATRKALDAGASEQEVLQVVALAATTIGFPSAVAASSWIEPILIDRMLV